MKKILLFSTLATGLALTGCNKASRTDTVATDTTRTTDQTVATTATTTDATAARVDAAGRTAANDLQIDSRFVSRHHCQIVTTSTSCVIEDLNSTNGIFIQGKRVRHHQLNDGDVICVGQHELLYIDERSQTRAAAEEHSSTTVLGDHTVETASQGGQPSSTALRITP